jgi:hypothetical protein
MYILVESALWEAVTGSGLGDQEYTFGGGLVSVRMRDSHDGCGDDEEGRVAVMYCERSVLEWM